MSKTTDRPLYNDFAGAYDLIIVGPVIRRCDFIQKTATRLGILPGSDILDAGCGTGNYSIELAKRGYGVIGLDASTGLVSVAKAKAEDSSSTATFQAGDILKLPYRPAFDGILCRGVLNDFVDSPSREQALFALTHALRKNGILILDVREWNASVLRKEKEPVFEKTVEIAGGILTFRAVTRLEHETKRLLVKESYILERENGSKTVTEYDFVMQCWTRDELHRGLVNAGVTSTAYYGDYDSDYSIGYTDRIVAVATI